MLISFLAQILLNDCNGGESFDGTLPHSEYNSRKHM